MHIPTDLKYTQTHEWIRIDGDTATIGITDHAQSELGDVVYLDLPAVGRVLQHEEAFGSVESVKTVSDLYAPVAGEVVAVNETLGAQPEIVNSDPYGSGWLLKVRLVSPESAATDLLDPEAYQATLG